MRGPLQSRHSRESGNPKIASPQVSGSRVTDTIALRPGGIQRSPCAGITGPLTSGRSYGRALGSEPLLAANDGERPGDDRQLGADDRDDGNVGNRLQPAG